MPGVRESRAPFRQGFRGECEIEEYDMQTLTQLPGIGGRVSVEASGTRLFKLTIPAGRDPGA